MRASFSSAFWSDQLVEDLRDRASAAAWRLYSVGSAGGGCAGRRSCGSLGAVDLARAPDRPLQASSGGSSGGGRGPGPRRVPPKSPWAMAESSEAATEAGREERYVGPHGTFVILGRMSTGFEAAGLWRMPWRRTRGGQARRRVDPGPVTAGPLTGGRAPIRSATGVHRPASRSRKAPFMFSSIARAVFGTSQRPLAEGLSAARAGDQRARTGDDGAGSTTRAAGQDRRVPRAPRRRAPPSTTLLPEAFAVVREAARPRARHAPFRRADDRRHGAARRQDRGDEDRRGQDAGRHPARLPQRAGRQAASMS